MRFMILFLFSFESALKITFVIGMMIDGVIYSSMIDLHLIQDENDSLVLITWKSLYFVSSCLLYRCERRMKMIEITALTNIPSFFFLIEIISHHFHLYLYWELIIFSKIGFLNFLMQVFFLDQGFTWLQHIEVFLYLMFRKKRKS